jgi:DNA-binding FrmR family transcriptional regulator
MKDTKVTNHHTAACCSDHEQICENRKTEDGSGTLEEAVLEGEETCGCGSGKHKQRTPEEQKALLTRLKRVEGQIRGIEKMVENNAYCPDILVQVSAATSALNSFNKVLLGCHIRGCVANDIREGKDETIDELCSVLQKLMK